MGFSGDKRLIAVIGTFLVVILISIGIYAFTNKPPAGAFPDTANVTRPENGTYLSDQSGKATRIYLVNSSMQYGTFDRDYEWPPGEYLAKKGDPCIMISGAIRNDYDADYYVGLTAYANNSSGEKVGKIVNTGWGDPWFAFVFYHVQSRDAEPFLIYLKYNETDVEGYGINAIFTSVSPPP